jgi:hypothetical protein
LFIIIMVLLIITNYIQSKYKMDVGGGTLWIVYKNKSINQVTKCLP